MVYVFFFALTLPAWNVCALRDFSQRHVLSFSSHSLQRFSLYSLLRFCLFIIFLFLFHMDLILAEMQVLWCILALETLFPALEKHQQDLSSRPV